MIGPVSGLSYGVGSSPQAEPKGLLGIRLLVVNWTRRRVGGTEDYLDSILPELSARGYTLAFFSEVDSQIDRMPIHMPTGVPDWSISQLGETLALTRIANWKPDLIYAHGELTVSLERRLLQIAPAIYFAHNYYGTCISGLKSHRWPEPRPCNRRLGVPCLVQYLPRRCGGLSPLTMVRRYLNEQKRLENLKAYRSIVTHSEHMRQEYIHHGIPPDRVFNFAYESGSSSQPEVREPTNLVSISLGNAQPAQSGLKPHRLLFLGRMEKLKGGRTLIDALPLVQSLLDAPIQATFAGDGPERKFWQRHARKIEDRHPTISFAFPGWLSAGHVSWHLDNTDVLVVPSLWPEPFGRVGIQAGKHGIPVAAFAVGGIPEWLKNGVNGFLAPGDPPTADGLAKAIVNCLDEASASDLRKAGRELAERFSTEHHLNRLVNVFDKTLADSSWSEKSRIS